MISRSAQRDWKVTNLDRPRMDMRLKVMHPPTDDARIGNQLKRDHEVFMSFATQPPYTNAKTHFNERVQGGNFMTPDIEEYGWIRKGQLSYELSNGEGIIDGTQLWGVTVSKRLHPTDDTVSRAWGTEEEARTYIDYLKARLGRGFRIRQPKGRAHG